jgi:hypothetical protein
MLPVGHIFRRLRLRDIGPEVGVQCVLRERIGVRFERVLRERVSSVEEVLQRRPVVFRFVVAFETVSSAVRVRGRSIRTLSVAAQFSRAA